MQPTVIIAFLGVAGGLPAGPFASARIAGLIGELDSYRFAQRDRAAKELVALGPAAIEPLKQALAGKPSAELARQAERILREIRYRSFTGGPTVAGFRAILRIPEETYSEGADIALEVEIVNVARGERPINPPVWWRFGVSAAAELDLLENISRACDGQILVRPLSAPCPSSGRFLTSAERKDKAPTAIGRSQSLVERVPLADYGRDLPPGDYEVHMAVHLSPFQPESREPLVTNMVRFTIVGRKK